MASKDFGKNESVKIEEFKVTSIDYERIIGYVVTKQKPFLSNNFIRYSGGGVAYDDPNLLTKTQKEYIKNKLDTIKT